jgi:3,4-dihydroxy 2-butanone 4-phosphate synthase / GTP cyclohydrolase II
MKFSPTAEIIEELKNGKIVILVDDEDRENEGDLVLAADFVTSQGINFMAKEARGLICLAMSGEKIDQLGLPLMVSDSRNQTPNKTAFTVSIEAADGVTTGISSADRAHTVKVASAKNATANDVHVPGHIFPIRARDGGVLERRGHTEGSVDLMRLAGLEAAAVICEVVNDDGTMARVPDLFQFAKRHNLKIGTIADLVDFRSSNELNVKSQQGLGELSLDFPKSSPAFASTPNTH